MAGTCSNQSTGGHGLFCLQATSVQALFGGSVCSLRWFEPFISIQGLFGSPSLLLDSWLLVIWYAASRFNGLRFYQAFDGILRISSLCFWWGSQTHAKTLHDWASANKQTKKDLLLFWENARLYQCDFFFFNQLLQQSISTAGTSGRYLRPFHLCYLSTSLYVHAGWTIIFPSDLKAISSSPSFRLLTSGESIPKPITNLGFLVGLVWKKGQLQSLCRGKGYLTPLCWRTRACTKPLVFFVIYSF